MMIFKILSDQSIKWSDKYEKQSDIHSSEKAKGITKKTAASRSCFAGFFDRALQALWKTWVQMCQYTWSWAQVLFVRQQAQAKTGDGLRSFELSTSSQRIFGKFSPNKNDSGRALRDQPRAFKAAGKALARPPPQTSKGRDDGLF
ncbi:MAG: hypothetical protein P8X55_18655 [Desulfosarcinaceae bacterium]